MSRPRTAHRCQQCRAPAPQWSGRCPRCGAWNALLAEVEATVPAGAGSGARPVALDQVDGGAWACRSTGLGELDRVLGGGLGAGSVTLLGGEPGIGKSTLVLQVMGHLSARGSRCLLVSAEEGEAQVRLRADRLGAIGPGTLVLSETALPAVLGAVGQEAPDYLVVDSIQTVHDPAVASPAGSVAQVRHCAHQLAGVAKRRGMATVLVGHVTKDGSLAGPRALEHLVDTVLSFEGDRHHSLRLLRAVKHRFGPTGELGLFEMSGDGLVGVPDPSALFLGDRLAGVPGSVVVPALEGHRPILVEVQALVTESELAVPRRSAQGLDSGRLALVLAVLARRAGHPMGRRDVHTSAVGGVRVVEPAADLALALALASAAADVALPAGLVACGEVGLAGEVRQVSQMGRRLAEAARLGFTAAVVAASAPAPPAGLQLHRVASVADAVSAVGLGRPAARSTASWAPRVAG